MSGSEVRADFGGSRSLRIQYSFHWLRFVGSILAVVGDGRAWYAIEAMQPKAALPTNPVRGRRNLSPDKRKYPRLAVGRDLTSRAAQGHSTQQRAHDVTSPLVQKRDDLEQLASNSLAHRVWPVGVEFPQPISEIP